VKQLLTRGLLKAIALPGAKRTEWLEAINAVMQHDLSRADVTSHFAVAADVIRKGMVTPAAYQHWTGRVIVLSAENDPTQSKSDVPRYEKLLGRTVEIINLGDMGHAAALFDPDRFVGLLEQALIRGVRCSGSTPTASVVTCARNEGRREQGGAGGG
jgi:pimeloyl-ACP methyl ester carboxylesterase